MIESISSFLLFMLEQSLLAAVLMLIVIFAAFFLKKAYPGFLLVLWLLIPVRLIIPADMVFPFDIADIFGAGLFSESSPSMSTLISGGDVIWTEMHDVIPSPSGLPQNLVTLIFSAWLMGFLYLMSRMLRAKLSLQRVVKSARRIDDHSVLLLLNRIEILMNCHRNVKVVVSDEFITTFTTGVLNPVICIPSSVYKNSNHKSLSAIISHELVHIKNYDDVLVNVLNVLRCVYFFHPAIWLAQFQIIQQRERLTDLAVVNSGVLTAADYAKVLINHIEYASVSTSSYVHPRLGSQFRFMKSRIEGLKKELGQEKKHCRLAAVALFIIMLCVVFPLQAGQKWRLSAEKKRAELQHSVYQNPKYQRPKYARPKYERPMKNTSISSQYGLRRHPITGKEHLHKGVDMPAAVGSPIYSVADGVVLDVKYGDKKRPNFIVLLHENGVQSRYFQVGDISVGVGDSVSSGALVAKVANPINGNGPHLHFEIFVEGKSVDPALYIDFTKVAGFQNSFIASFYSMP